MDRMASQITSFTIVYSTVYSAADQRKHQSSVSLAFVWEIHRRPVNSPHKWPVTRKMFPFDDVIMINDGWVVLKYNIKTSLGKGHMPMNATKANSIRVNMNVYIFVVFYPQNVRCHDMIGSFTICNLIRRESFIITSIVYIE